MADVLPRMYGDLANWFPLISPPGEYREEAAFYLERIVEASHTPPTSLLELGAGAGSNALHYKRRLKHVTLTDLSEQMLRLSRQLNSDCEHIQGDMRTLRLGRTFDAVFIHDAVSYLINLDELRQALETAFVHCRAGGVVLLAPDHVRENFASGTDHGGSDGDGRAIRYLEWTYDPDSSDSTYNVDYAYILHAHGKPTRTVYDRHVCGLFSRSEWLASLQRVGFTEARSVPFDHSELPPGSLEVFVARRGADASGH